MYIALTIYVVLSVLLFVGSRGAALHTLDTPWNEKTRGDKVAHIWTLFLAGPALIIFFVIYMIHAWWKS